MIVLTAVSQIEDIFLNDNLRKSKIAQSSLESVLNIVTLELSIDKLVNRLLTICNKPSLTKRQKSDFKKYIYQCYDKIYIPGIVLRNKSNKLVVNGQEVKLCDSLFILFIRLVVELKKKKGGWISVYNLYDESIIFDPQRYQKYSNLRIAIQGSLLEKDGISFIENDGSKHYRISTHPDFITWDRMALLNYPDERVKEIIGLFIISHKKKN